MRLRYGMTAALAALVAMDHSPVPGVAITKSKQSRPKPVKRKDERAAKRFKLKGVRP